ncbi:MAG TPA: hypothetical protein V6D25_18745 [Leptolyngbyaceae cyanobacterium]
MCSPICDQLRRKRFAIAPFDNHFHPVVRSLFYKSTICLLEV